MYRRANYIEAGRSRIKSNPQRGLRAPEIATILDAAAGDTYLAIGKAFYMGVETGARIVEKEADKQA